MTTTEKQQPSTLNALMASVHQINARVAEHKRKIDKHTNAMLELRESADQMWEQMAASVNKRLRCQLGDALAQDRTPRRCYDILAKKWVPFISHRSSVGMDQPEVILRREVFYEDGGTANTDHRLLLVCRYFHDELPKEVEGFVDAIRAELAAAEPTDVAVPAKLKLTLRECCAALTAPPGFLGMPAYPVLEQHKVRQFRKLTKKLDYTDLELEHDETYLCATVDLSETKLVVRGGRSRFTHPGGKDAFPRISDIPAVQLDGTKLTLRHPGGDVAGLRQMIHTAMAAAGCEGFHVVWQDGLDTDGLTNPAQVCDTVPTDDPDQPPQPRG